MEAWRKIYASCWLGPPDGRGCMVPPGPDSFSAKMVARHQGGTHQQAVTSGHDFTFWVEDACSAFCFLAHVAGAMRCC